MARKSKRHSCGMSACFHGAFKSKSAAHAKAKSVGGNVIKRRIQGRDRHVVITGRK